MNETIRAATVSERTVVPRDTSTIVRLLARAALLAALLPVVAQAQGRAECRLVPSAILKRSVRYCVLLPPGFDADKTRRFPVLYYLHGLGDNEQSLLQTGGWEVIEQFRE